jgi:lysozyme|tara:strand:- start:498 stop:980 length:483 start_codon:yes stop_codon:yes gene_type:complete
MDNIDSDKFKLLKMLTLHEGLKLKVYDDANGKELKAGDTLIGHPTIGVGRNVASDGLGINEEEANFLLMGDIARIDREAKQWSVYVNLDDIRKSVILDMLFNMGMTRFNPSKWPNMFKAIEEENWDEASNQMLDSKWAKQVKSRADRLSQIMITGDWPEE